MKHNIILLILLGITTSYLFSAAIIYDEPRATAVSSQSHNSGDKQLLSKLAQLRPQDGGVKSPEFIQLCEQIKSLSPSRVKELNNISRQIAVFGYRPERTIVNEVPLRAFFEKTTSFAKKKDLYLSTQSGKITPVNINNNCQVFSNLSSIQLLTEEYRKENNDYIYLLAHDEEKYVFYTDKIAKQELVICDRKTGDYVIPLSCSSPTFPYRKLLLCTPTIIMFSVANWPHPRDYATDPIPEFIEIIDIQKRSVDHKPIIIKGNPETSSVLLEYDSMYTSDNAHCRIIGNHECHFIGFHKPSGQAHYRSYLPMNYKETCKRAVGVKTAHGCVLELQRNNVSSELIYVTPITEQLIYNFNKEERMNSETLKTFPNNPNKIVYETIVGNDHSESFIAQITIIDLENNTSTTIPLKNKRIWAIQTLKTGSILMKNCDHKSISTIDPITLKAVLREQ